MGLFNSTKGKQQIGQNPSNNTIEVMAKCMAAVRAYQNQDFNLAAKLFEEYFELKGYGKYPQLDMDDYRMYINLMLSQFYSHDYDSCIKTCEKISSFEPKRGDCYAFKALSLFKLGNASDADFYWERAKLLGSELPSHFSNIRNVKMQGFNN